MKSRSHGKLRTAWITILPLRVLAERSTIRRAVAGCYHLQLMRLQMVVNCENKVPLYQNSIIPNNVVEIQIRQFPFHKTWQMNTCILREIYTASNVVGWG